MKTDDILILAAAAGAVWFILTRGASLVKTSPAPVAQSGKPAGWTSEIYDSDGSSFSNGWRYFDDGTAIDPAGNYYSGGQLVWSHP